MKQAQTKWLVIGVALLLTACIVGSHRALSSRRAATSTTGRPVSASLSARVFLPSKTITAGATVQAKIIVENNTGSALQVPGCGSLFAVALGNDTSPPAVAWTTCLRILTVPVGESSFAVPVIASYLSCGTGSPYGPCTDGHPAALPPGTYEAHLYQSANTIPAPAPISVRVTR